MRPEPPHWQVVRRRLLDHRGPSAAAWVAHLRSIVEACAERWSLTLGPPVPNVTFNYVATVQRADGSPAVLKVCPTGSEFEAESGAMALYAGTGAAKLLDVDAERGAMLLERLEPGTSLWDAEDDDAATVAIASVMQQLWRPLPADHPFPTVADWGQGFAEMRVRFDGGSGPIPPHLADSAERLFVELERTMAAPVLLHGDLHHDNVLSARRQPWLAIDPQGVVGEPAYEVGALMRNPHASVLSRPDPRRLLARRLDILADTLGFDRERMRAWSFAQAILSAWWTVEGGVGDPSFAIACAELLT